MGGGSTVDLATTQEVIRPATGSTLALIGAIITALPDPVQTPENRRRWAI